MMISGHGDWTDLPLDARVRILTGLRLEQTRAASGKAFPALSTLVNSETGRKYIPHETTRAFHQSDKRYVGLFGGLGSGKTTAGAMEALKRIKAGLPGAIVGPDYKHFIRSAFDEFSKWCPWEHLIAQNKKESWWKFDTGAKVFYGGIDDPDSYRGPNLNWIWFDEGARKRDDKAWRVLVGRIRVGKSPRLFITTTPKPHWLKRVFVTSPPISKETGENFSDYFTVSTRENQANLDPGYYESLLATYSGKFAEQELEGKFVGLEGLVYADFSLSKWPNGNIYPCGDPSRPVELAIDDGFVDPRVILVIQKTEHTIDVLYEHYRTRQLEETTISESLSWLEKNDYLLPEIAIYSHERPTLGVRLKQVGIPARNKRWSIKDRLTRVRSLIKDGNGRRTLRVHPTCTNLIAELTEGYRYPDEDDKLGRNRDEELPIDANNHCCDALGMWSEMRYRL